MDNIWIERIEAYTQVINAMTDDNGDLLSCFDLETAKDFIRVIRARRDFARDKVEILNNA